MKKFLVDVAWGMEATIEIVAKDENEAAQKAREMPGLPNGLYAESSFYVNEETVRESKQ